MIFKNPLILAGFVFSFGKQSFFSDFSSMESMNLQHLSLFINEHVYVIPGDSLEAPNLTSSAQVSGENALSDPQEIEKIIEEEPSQLPLSYEGNFEKGVLIILDEPELRDELQDLLFKILGAVGCSLKDIALVLGRQLDGTTMDSIHDLSPSKVIMFGKVAHDIMHYRDELYKIHVEDSIEFLFADDLSSIQTNVTMKKSLWNQLQILFGINK